ncbi:MAG TPA: T9SS type A sorting domain-containing protein [Ignavibacteria bacterium]|nr:T9SS type A sorting domain-containing protein [Ignavibacteria bacterium]
MKKFIIQLFIVCLFAAGFKGTCFYVPTDFDDALYSLIYGFRYNNSDAGFVDNYYLAAGADGKIYRSTDPLTDPWIEKNSGTANNINCLKNSGRSDTAVTFGAGDLGTIVRSLDQGMTWTVINSNVTGKLNSIEFVGSDINNVIAAGDSGLIILSTNCGVNWTVINAGVTNNLNSVYSLNSFNTFIAGDKGTLLQSSNGGMTWNNRSLPDTASNLNKIGTMGTWFFGTILGMVGDNGTLYRTTNFLFWDSIPTGTSEDLYEIKFKNASSGYVGGENGVIRYTTNGGNEWFSDFFISSVNTERVSSTLILNDTVSAGVAGNKIIVLHANETLLPVELSAFTHTVNSNTVNLIWSTSSEINNSGFDIERTSLSINSSQDWKKIGFVKGNGTASTLNNYDFTDRRLNPGKYNYRLKQIDYNGNYEYYSLTDEVTIGAPDKYNLSQNYPNPFNPSTNIAFEISKPGLVKLTVYDLRGIEIRTLVNENKPAGRYEIKFDGSNLSSGIYFYKINSDGYTFTRKMILTK